MADQKRLTGKTAIVTGGGQGVGLGCARGLAAAGAAVLIAQRTVDQGQAEAKRLRDDFGVDADFLRTDVTKRDQVFAMVDHAEKRFGKVDVLVNNAGGGALGKRLEAHTDEEVAAALDLNLWSSLWGMQAVFPGMKARGWGRIINMGSLSSVRAMAFNLSYNVAKDAVIGLTRTAAVEWGRHGIIINCICPGVTTAGAEAYYAANPAVAERVLSTKPTRRNGEPEADVGPVAVMLASDDCAHMTGMVFYVDGGAHINGFLSQADPPSGG
jgi:NAD(P)-dependent dehydrogenase (short-subunit alcohol dehydrogenase family)